MSRSTGPEDPSIPNTEALNLSASIFNSSISSWIPANFGHALPAAEAEKEWQTLLRSAGEGKDRLGLGHPAINAPKAGGGYKHGIQGLEKSLKNGKRRQGEEAKERGDEVEVNKKEEDSEEEESRASMVGKRKRVAAFDPLGGKKKKGGQKSTTASTDTSARASPAVVDNPSGNISVAPAQLDPDIISTSRGPSSTPLPESIASTEDQTISTPASLAKSKSALKRERKKLAKLAKLQAEQA